MSSSEEEQIYCICRSTDVSRFMIGCEHCNDWFHGDCVNVSERESKYIKHYYCDECRKKNSNLTITFRSKHKDLAPVAAAVSASGSSSGANNREKDKSHKEQQHRSKEKEKRPESQHHHHHHKEPNKEKHQDKPAKESKDSAAIAAAELKDKERDREKEKEKEKEREKRKEKERMERRKEKEKRKEREREERRKERRKEKEKRKEAEREKKRKRQEDEERRMLKEKAIREQQEERALKAKDNSQQQQQESNKRKRDHSPSDNSPLRPPPAKKAVLHERNVSDDDDVWEPPVATAAKKTKEKAQNKKKPPPPMYGKKRRGRRDSTSDDEPLVDLTPKQCFGPNCLKSTRPNSKYCSDQCGINLASLRIYQTLPDRIREWNVTPCAAEKQNRKELEVIRAKQTQVKNRLEQLNVEFQMLEDIIAKGKTLVIEENDDDDEDESGEMTIYCVTCGAPITANTAIRHMEKCYNKIESQTSFASKYKTQIEDHRMFCDFYNPKEESYCKRLQVLCPEHNPDPKIGDDEVCGYPLQKELFAKPTSFCLKEKKTCHMHFSWEKLRRAELDMERVKQWMKVDELIEQERQVKASITSRAGVLGLMLHSTFNHELDGRWQAQRAAAAAQQQQQQQKMHIAQLKQKPSS